MYTEKIDCFSFGVITVQVLTRQFPKPGDRQITVNDPRYPQGALKMCVPEIERRQIHISEVDPNHFLLPIALDCLKDRDVDRPSAQQLCDRVAALKEGSEYRDDQNKQDSSAKDRTHAQQVKSLQWIIQSQLNRLEEKDHFLRQETLRLEIEKDQAVEEKERQLRQETQRLEREKVQVLEEKERLLRQETQRLEQEKVQVLEERERQLRHVTQQLEESEQIIADFERRIIELEQLTCRLKDDQSQTQNPNASNRAENRASIKLRWREGGRAPCRMSRVASGAIVENSMVYFLDGDKSVFAYDTTRSKWSPIPQCPLKGGFDITIINGLLTTIGGYGDSFEDTNQLFSLTREGSGQKWTKKFPPMPTKRYGVTALCTGTVLIVVGGTNNDQDLKTVEVMNTETCQWSIAADLPEPLNGSSFAVCGDHVYQLGGWDKNNKQTKSVYSFSLSRLLLSCGSKPLGSTLSLSVKGSVWNRIADLPVTCSTCVSAHGQLLTIGGNDSDDIPTTAIHKYNPTTNSWEVISHMAAPRYWCLAAVLPDNQLMVAGGFTGARTDTDSVEFANVI